MNHYSVSINNKRWRSRWQAKMWKRRQSLTRERGSPHVGKRLSYMGSCITQKILVTFVGNKNYRPKLYLYGQQTPEINRNQIKDPIPSSVL